MTEEGMSKKDTALEVIQDAIEQSAEGLLDSTGVDEKATKELAEGIVKDLHRRHLLVSEKQKDVTRYLIIFYGDKDPAMKGPYATIEERNQAADEYRRKGDSNRIIDLHHLNIDAEGKPQIRAI
jgi:hypothetical protein